MDVYSRNEKIGKNSLKVVIGREEVPGRVEGQRIVSCYPDIREDSAGAARRQRRILRRTQEVRVNKLTRQDLVENFQVFVGAGGNPAARKIRCRLRGRISFQPSPAFIAGHGRKAYSAG
jgi:hypothetical protein